MEVVKSIRGETIDGLERVFIDTMVVAKKYFQAHDDDLESVSLVWDEGEALYKASALSAADKPIEVVFSHPSEPKTAMLGVYNQLV